MRSATPLVASFMWAATCVGAAGAGLGGCNKKSDASAAAGGVPGALRGAAGALATVSFVRTTDQTCATEVVFPDLDLKKSLPLNTPVTVDVPSDAPRTLSFQCGMGMYKGAVVVR